MISKFSKFYSKFITGGSGEAPVEGGRSGGGDAWWLQLVILK